MKNFLIIHPSIRWFIWFTPFVLLFSIGVPLVIQSFPWSWWMWLIYTIYLTLCAICVGWIDDKWLDRYYSNK